MGEDEKEVFEVKPCSHPNCIAREPDCIEDDQFCFWKDSNWPAIKKEESKDSSDVP